MNAPLRHPDHRVDPQFTGRWSPRAFTEETLSEPQVLALLEAARWAPSAINAQPWRFAWALRGTEAFAAIHDALMPGNQPWAGKAAALVAVASATTRTGQDGAVVPHASHAFDTGAAWANLALQAHLAGLAAHAMGGFDAARLAAATGLPEGHVLHAVVAVGRPGAADLLPEPYRGRETPSGRKPLSEIAGRGQFPV